MRPPTNRKLLRIHVVPGGAFALLLGLALLPRSAAAGSPPAPSTSPAPASGGRKSAVSPAPGSDVVARVNGHPILRRDFDLAVQMQFRRRRTPVGLGELQAVREKVLDGLIDNELLYQKAVKTEPPVSDADVDAEFQKMKEGFSSPETFFAALKKNGVSETDFKEQLRRTLLVTRFVDTRVAADVKVPDEEVRRYYDQNPDEVRRKEGVKVAQILVRVSSDAAPQARAAAREKVEAILKELKGGGEFSDLARKYSDGREAASGGEVGWIVRGGGPPAIESAAFALQVGQTSDVVESRVGFHILKVVATRPEGAIPFDEAKDGLRSKLEAKGRADTIRAYVDTLKEQARVERSLKKTP